MANGRGECGDRHGEGLKTTCSDIHGFLPGKVCLHLGEHEIFMKKHEEKRAEKCAGKSGGTFSVDRYTGSTSCKVSERTSRQMQLLASRRFSDSVHDL